MAEYAIAIPPYVWVVVSDRGRGKYGCRFIDVIGWRVTYCFTVNMLERCPNDLLVRHIELLRSVVRKVRGKRPFHIDAWVKEEKGREENGARNHYEPQQAKKSDDGVSRIC